MVRAAFTCSANRGGRHSESPESQHLSTQRQRLSIRCLVGELTSRYRLGLRMGLRLRRVFNDGAERIKQVDNVIPSTSAKGTQFQEL